VRTNMTRGLAMFGLRERWRELHGIGMCDCGAQRSHVSLSDSVG